MSIKFTSAVRKAALLTALPASIVILASENSSARPRDIYASEKVVYSFTGASDGGVPYGQLASLEPISSARPMSGELAIKEPYFL
jgi:hypothetical protein